MPHTTPAVTAEETYRGTPEIIRRVGEVGSVWSSVAFESTDARILASREGGRRVGHERGQRDAELRGLGDRFEERIQIDVAAGRNRAEPDDRADPGRRREGEVAEVGDVELAGDVAGEAVADDGRRRGRGVLGQLAADDRQPGELVEPDDFLAEDGVGGGILLAFGDPSGGRVFVDEGDAQAVDGVGWKTVATCIAIDRSITGRTMS